MTCCCTMAGTKNCLYCSNRNFSMNGYNFSEVSEYDFPQVERIIIEFPKVKRNIVTTTTCTIPYEIR